jgi:hypothetical protein
MTAYRSPRQSPKGDFGFYEQQNSLLLAAGILTPKVRREFIKDIASYINDLQTEEYEVILSLVVNETLGEDRDLD